MVLPQRKNYPNPGQMTKFAVAQGIDVEIVFMLWVEHVLKKRDRIIASIKKQQARYLKKSPKFGIELPKTAEQIWAWLPRMAMPYGQMQYLKSERMLKWNDIFYQMGKKHLLATNLCNAIWYLYQNGGFQM